MIDIKIKKKLLEESRNCPTTAYKGLYVGKKKIVNL